MSEALLYSDIFKEIDALINSFQIEEARQRLTKLDASKIPKKDRAQMASLARRSGELKLAIKILQPNVFGAGRPEYDDLIEYASSVRKLGLINQALILLERAPEYPKTHLNRAFCHIHYWNYKKAQSELEKFLNHEELATKDKLVGNINLVVCLVENQEYDRALKLLVELEEECEKNSPHLLLNLKETRGQIFYKTGKLDEATSLLEELKKQTGQQVAQTSFFIEKWLLLAKLKQGKITPESLEVKAFFKNSRDNGMWEVIRDFTWQLALITENHEQMNHVFFGTPFPHFREHMLKQWGKATFPIIFDWKDGRPWQGESQTFDFYKMKDVPVSYGKSIHRLLMLLSADFYQPWSVVRIFNSLFPEELFDPNTSIKKVYRLVEQLGQLIKKEKMHLTLETTSGGYRLRPTPGCVFKMHREMIFSSREQFLAHLLYQNGLSHRFRAKDAFGIIPLSQHQWYRAFKNLEDQGFIEPVSESSTFYNLKKVS